METKDWAVIGIGTGAYIEASRARAGVDHLSVELLRLKNDIDKQKHEKEFKKWVDELIYQFDKTVTAVSTSPADPVHDYTDISSFLHLIEKNKLNTALISGHENKAKFEKTLVKAQEIITKMEEISEVQDYLHNLQEEERLRKEEERLQEEERWQKINAEHAKAQAVLLKKIKTVSKVFWLFLVFVICSYFINNSLFYASIAGFVIFIIFFREDLGEAIQLAKLSAEKRKKS